MAVLLTMSNYIIPVTMLFIVVYGILNGVRIYETFLEGAKEGLQTVVEILPTLIGLIVAVEVFQNGGLLEICTNLIRPLVEPLGFPAEIAPLSVIRLVSSSAAIGLLVDIFQTYGPDSYMGRVASVMMSCTETVFYTMSVYFLAVGIRKTRYTLPCALITNFVGVLVAIWLVGVVW